MAKIILEFGSQRELDNFITDYIKNSLKHAQGIELDSAERYASEEFESATRWSDSKRTHVSIQDMQTNHLFNSLAQRIVELRQNKGNGFVEDFTLSALVWHCWKRVAESIRENVICEE